MRNRASQAMLPLLQAPNQALRPCKVCSSAYWKTWAEISADDMPCHTEVRCASFRSVKTHYHNITTNNTTSMITSRITGVATLIVINKDETAPIGQ
jgi:hypothetical protein